MTQRSIKEIEKDIKTCKDEYRELHNKAWNSKMHRFNNIGAIEELNKLTHRITNLKLELNRAKIRDWGNKAKGDV